MDREERIEISGEIVAVDVVERTCKVAQDANGAVIVYFRPDHENIIMEVFQRHSEKRVIVIGKGDSNIIHDIEDIKTSSPTDSYPKELSLSIEGCIADIVADVPEEEWSNIPVDLSKNLDRYLYGNLK